jgi:hypothetical protein
MKELQTIKTIDENGEEINLKLMDIVNVDGQEYALLLPEDADIENDDAEVILMRLKTEGESYVFEAIEDDDEFDLVSQAIIDDFEQSAD